MTNRWFRDAGIHPLVGYLLSFAAFVGISAYMFFKTQYAVYAYPLLALTVVAKLSEVRRTDFLSQCFPKKKLIQLRVVENLMAALPFVFFLCCKLQFLSATITLLAAILLAFANFRTTFNIVIPTPFYKKPFEFIVGFRNSFYLIIVAYLLALISVFVDNPNLGLFALMLTFFICVFFYVKIENEFYVWSYRINGRQFLLRKIGVGLSQVSIVAMPIVLLLCCMFYMEVANILLLLGLGYLFLIYMIVSKYAAYPKEMSLMQLILFGVSITMPPFLIILIPYFFSRSTKHLNELLNDKAAASH